MAPDGTNVRVEIAGVRGPGVGPAAAQSDYPLTYLQREIWFHCQLDASTPLHRSGIAVTLHGLLDRALLVRAIQAVVDRQSVLRTSCRNVNGVPRQVIAQDLPVDLFFEDVSDVDPAVRLRRLVERFRRIESDAFDLGRAPLWRAALLRFEEREHILAFFFHHLIVDVYHAGAILGEIGSTYSRFAAGDLTPLPPLSLEYRDYAVWLDERRGDGRAAEDEAYWLSELRASRADSRIPRDRQAPPNRGFVVDGLFRRLDDRLVEELIPLARSCRATPYGLLLTAFALMLGRLTGGREAIIGQPFSVRPPELRDVAGMYANPLPIRVPIDPRRSFRELAGDVRRNVDAARRRRDVALMDALRRMCRDGEQERIAPLRVSMSQMAAIDLQLPHLHMVQTPSVFGVTNPYDLWLGVRELSPGITLTFGYASELFDRDSVNRLATVFETLLEDAVHHPERPIGDLQMMSAADRRAVIGLSTTSAAVPGVDERSIPELIAEHARNRPHALAITGGSSALTYAELDARADALARRLRAQGVRPEVLVPIFASVSADCVVGMLAVLKAGGGYVLCDPGTPPLRLNRLLAAFDAPVILTERPRLRELAEAGASMTTVNCLDDAPDAADGERLPPVCAPSPACVVLVSSGAAVPAGVVHSHGSLARIADAARDLGINAADAVLQASPYAADGSTVEIWGTLASGARLVVVEPTTVGDSEILGETLDRERVSVLLLPALRFNQVIDRVADKLGGLRTLLVHGEPVSIPHMQRARAQLPHVRLVHTYGPAENATFSGWEAVEQIADAAPSIHVGRPVAGSSIHVLDEKLQPMPIKVRGEVYVGGQGLARGYLLDARATAEKFVPSPFARGERLYRTGDWGRWHADGTLELLGRSDRRVICHGFHVEPGEIESVLREHPAVDDAAVIPRGGTAVDLQWLAFVVVDSATPEESLRAHVDGRLPAHLRPGRYVVVDALPLDEDGRIDWDTLQARGDASVPFEIDGSLEHVVAAVWREVLGVARVGLDDNFFEIGGDSLSCVRIAGRLRARGLTLRERDVFTHQTVAAQAACLRRRADEPSPTGGSLEGPVASPVEEDELARLLASEGDA